MLMNKVDKFWQLPRRDRRQLFQSFLLLPAIHLGLLSLSYYRLRGLMEKLSPFPATPTSTSESEVVQRARGIARVVAIAAEHGIYKATCLRRSLLLWWFLRREGIQSQIRFGVHMSDHGLEAHAWVERAGIILNDSATVHESYQSLDDGFPSTSLGL